MVNSLKTNIFVVIILIVSFHARSQEFIEIGKGYAKNSVNAPVFRKNSVTSFNGIQYTSFYDSVGNVILAKRKLGTNNWETHKTKHTGSQTDAHCSISIGVDGNGIVHMAWDHHGNPLNYCVSKASASLEMGDKKDMVGNLESNVTYPEFFRMPNGDLLFMYRDGASGRGNLVINKYVLAEKKWKRLHDILIDGQGARNAYWQSCVDKSGTIHVSWVWRETWDVSTNHDMCYAKSGDGGETWQKSTGEQYTVPITASTAEYSIDIPQKSELINQTSIYATSDGTPYIASYWNNAVTSSPQYHIIYLDKLGNWQEKTFSDRLTDFSLSGGGTKKIPISRPQIMVDESTEKPTVYMVYRDSERDSKVSVNVCRNLNVDTLEIEVHDLTSFTVSSWEPSYDIDLWKDSSRLDIFVQNMGQGDGETLEELNAQPVYVVTFPKNSVAIENIHTPVVVASAASSPVPALGSKKVGTDTTLTWDAGENTEMHLVYFGTSSSKMELVAETENNSYQLTNLQPGTRYYWRVNEKNGEHITKGGLWYFYTNTSTGQKMQESDLVQIEMYPQPVKSFLNIHGTQDNVAITVYNVSGTLVQHYSKANLPCVLNLEGLDNGIYYMQIKNDDYSKAFKFIKE